MLVPGTELVAAGLSGGDCVLNTLSLEFATPLVRYANSSQPFGVGFSRLAS